MKPSNRSSSPFSSQARRAGPGFDGQVLVGADLCVEVGKFALKRLTGSHGAIEDHALIGRVAVVTGDAQPSDSPSSGASAVP
jgi:hypothetical protein